MVTVENGRKVAYFTMEVGLEPSMPTYSGGLGVLAGDTLRAAADLEVPMVGITLLHRKGYFRQQLDAQGNQTETPATWAPERYLEALEPRVWVVLEGRRVCVCCWRLVLHGIAGSQVPVYFLDTCLEQNSPWDQTLTDHLYGGDQHYRICQEVILGMGGLAMLRALGHGDIQVFHMNEGHSAFLALGLLAEEAAQRPIQEGSRLLAAVHETVRRKCVFTTHTPVPAGNDQFPAELVRHVLGDNWSATLHAECCLNGTLNMTYLALYFAHYINGVAMRHGEISRDMYPGYPVNSITNGVHAGTWTSAPLQAMYDRHIPEWRRDNLYLRYAISIPCEEILQAHAEAKAALLAEVERRTAVRLDPLALTLGFARRATAYKQADLLFTELDQLRRIAQQRPLQIVYAGKAHPRDEGGKAVIRRVFEAARVLGGSARVVYLEDYDMALAKLLCSGVDVWLNTPQRPHEASGTSGMKAALNGVPSLSILDGWWLEGHLEGTTGWSIGTDGTGPGDANDEARSLYSKLEYVILPLFYQRPLAFAEVMRSAIALNGSFFNSQRMVGQYLRNAYFPWHGPDVPATVVSPPATH